MDSIARVGIVGGGLAGLAAAVALAPRGIQVEIFESKGHLGGRMASVDDAGSGETLEYCQPIGMGCDVNFQQLCRQVGATKHFEQIGRLHFFGPDGRRSDLYAIPGLSAPLHLAASFLRLRFLTWKERWAIIRALRELAPPLREEDAELSVLRWLRLRDQSTQAIERFWSVVLENALGAPLEEASLTAARRLLLDGFLLQRGGYVARVAASNLDDALLTPLKEWLEDRGVRIYVASPVRFVLGSLDRCRGILLEDGGTRPFDVVIAATSWRGLPGLLSEGLRPAIRAFRFDRWKSFAMTGVHLWFDRPLTPLTHAIFTSGRIQWALRRHRRAAADVVGASGFHYEVILRAPGRQEEQSAETTLAEVIADLQRVWPASRDAKLVRSQFVCDADAMFSLTVQGEAERPSQETMVPNLMLAGDWTRTGAATAMESAVRSGNLAAETVLRYLGRPAKVVATEPAADWLARRLFLS